MGYVNFLEGTNFQRHPSTADLQAFQGKLRKLRKIAAGEEDVDAALDGPAAAAPFSMPVTPQAPATSKAWGGLGWAAIPHLLCHTLPNYTQVFLFGLSKKKLLGRFQEFLCVKSGKNLWSFECPFELDIFLLWLFQVFCLIFFLNPQKMWERKKIHFWETPFFRW